MTAPPRPDCVALVSGMLDSLLAVCLVQRQGLRVEGLHFQSVFSSLTEKAQAGAERLGIRLAVLHADDDYLDLVRHPRFGYGRAVNPCVDCRIYWFRRARQWMEQSGARFVISGEVLGQKPFGQKRRDLIRIAHHAGLEDTLVRPLSAQRLPETIPERNGWLDRSRLMGLAGSSRRPQRQLGQRWGLGDWPEARGGCALTEKLFAEKVRQLWEDGRPSNWDYELLRIGRHVRLDRRRKLVIARRHEENLQLEELCGRPGARPHERLRPDGFAGPSVLIVGPSDERAQYAAARMIAHYSRSAPDPMPLERRLWSGETRRASYRHSDFADDVDAIPRGGLATGS